MEQDELIIWVSVWVCEQLEALRATWPHQRARRGGFDPALSDEEALTIELCGEMFRLNSDKAIVAHFQRHYRDWFPHLRDRTAFARQVANLWRVKESLQQRLLWAHDVHRQLLQPIDTMPLPVCGKARSKRDRVFAGLARKGFCAAKDTFYYGFKLGLRVSEQGFIAHYALLEANTHDCRHLPALVEGIAEVALEHHTRVLVPVDKGFFDSTGWRLLFNRGVHLVGRGPKRVDKHRPAELRLSDFVERLCAKVRKQVEVVASLLCSRFHVERIRVHDLWHFEHRLLRKILAFNLLIACNIHHHRHSLDFDGLIRD
ncbi:hypothetical protein IAD21_03942 [Abditibacteriota bacterium]|nr:hypothetical protein IAD21_03942 [Abditibacteriota bacterium]